MRVILLTESEKGTAAHHLPYLLESEKIKVVMVIRSRGIKADKKKYWSKKIRKSFTIGPLGVINGFRMRTWFGENVNQLLRLPPLKEICAVNGIEYAEVDYTNGNDTVELFKKANADIGISLGNSYISKKVFSLPAHGMINIHHEILPEYQNAQSIIWQLYNNSAETGYTIHKITPKIDGGDILFQEKVPIVFKEKLSDTIAHTSASLLKASAIGLVRVLENFNIYTGQAKPQGQGKCYTTPTGLQFFRIVRNFNRLKKQYGA
jgi:methionyl-tRNA formyltransferase